MASSDLNRARFLDKLIRLFTFGRLNYSKQIEKSLREQYRHRLDLEEYLLNTREYLKLSQFIRECKIEGSNITKVDPIGPITGFREEYGSDWEDTTRTIRERDNNMCQEADGHCYGPLQVHHVIPISHGGTNSDGNLIALCKYHHSLKHPHMQKDWSAY